MDDMSKDIGEALLAAKTRQMEKDGKLPSLEATPDLPVLDRTKVYYLEVTAAKDVVDLSPQREASVARIEALERKVERFKVDSAGLEGDKAKEAKKVIGKAQHDLDQALGEHRKIEEEYLKAEKAANWRPAAYYKKWLGHSYGHNRRLAEEAITFVKKQDLPSAKGQVVYRIRAEPIKKTEARKKSASKSKRS